MPYPSDAGALQWPNGCPAGNECCTEYGYCHPQSAWIAKAFRDCNGVSNGMPYPSDVIQAESAAAAQGDTRGLALLSAAGAPTLNAATYAGLDGASGAFGNTAANGAGYGFGAAGSGAAGIAGGVTGFGVAGAYGAGLVSFPNGAIVPADTADVAAAKFEHLKAHSYA